MKKLAGVVLLLLSEAAMAAGGNVTMAMGIRQLDHWLFDALSVDQQLAIGVMSDFRFGDSPWHAEIGLRASADEHDQLDLTVGMADFSAGLKFMPGRGVMRPYAGAGVTGMVVAVEDSDEDEEFSVGYYFGGGSLFRLGKHLTLGMDLRWTRGASGSVFFHSPTSGTRREWEVDFNSFSAMALLGFGWGR